MPNARPARSGLATTSRRRAPPASGGVRRSRPLAQTAWEQGISQTEGVISFRHVILRAQCRHGRRERDHCSGGACDSVCGASRHPCCQGVAARATSTWPTPRERNVGQHAPFRQAHCRAYATPSAGMVASMYPNGPCSRQPTMGSQNVAAKQSRPLDSFRGLTMVAWLKSKHESRISNVNRINTGGATRDHSVFDHGCFQAFRDKTTLQK